MYKTLELIFIKLYYINMDINKKHLIITGATGGLGGSLTKLLSNYDCTITVIGRNNNILKELEKDFNVIPLCLDLTTTKGREKFSNYVKNNPADILINCAGILNIEEFHKCSLNNIDDVININLTALIMTSRFCLEHMLKKNTRCKIVNIGSIGGDLALPYFTTYTATKFAVKGFCESLRRELLGTNVGVILIAPRAMKTPMIDEEAVELLKAMFSVMDDVEKVARKIIRAIEKDKSYMRVGILERFGGFVNSIFPQIINIVFRIITPTMKKYVKKMNR